MPCKVTRRPRVLKHVLIQSANEKERKGVQYIYKNNIYISRTKELDYFHDLKPMSQ